MYVMQSGDQPIIETLGRHGMSLLISWLVIDNTGAEPAQIAPNTLTGSPTLIIHKRFQDGFDLWEPVTGAPIALDDPAATAVASNLLGDGDYRFTLTNLQANTELWIQVVASSN